MEELLAYLKDRKDLLKKEIRKYGSISKKSELLIVELHDIEKHIDKLESFVLKAKRLTEFLTDNIISDFDKTPLENIIMKSRYLNAKKEEARPTMKDATSKPASMISTNR